MTDGRERVIFAKFSTSRSRANSVKTVLTKVGEEISVRKIPLFPEATESLREMNEKKGLLPVAFPGCDVCGCEPEGDALKFEYIRGNSLAATYWRAYQTNDKELFYDNIERHKKLLLSNADNHGFFTPSDEFITFFGSRYPYEGLDALKCSNFEATAFNIIFEESTGQPIFFDYECIYDFPMPEDLVKYHCIYRTLYLCMPFLNSFVQPSDFLSRLDLQVQWKQLERTWNRWRKNFSFGKGLVKPAPAPEENTETDEAEDFRFARTAVSAEREESPTRTPEQGGESTEEEPKVHVTLTEVKNNYSKRFYEVTDLNIILNTMKRRQDTKRMLKKFLPGRLYSSLKRNYQRVRQRGRKGR